MALFTKEEEKLIVQEIQRAEMHTTGEIRVFVEDFCLYDSPVERAAEVFQMHQMSATTKRNGVLIYLAERSRHYAIYGDEGIYPKMPIEFWLQEKAGLQSYFKQARFAEGIILAVREVGFALAQHFPGDGTHRNELSDEIIYG